MPPIPPLNLTGGAAESGVGGGSTFAGPSGGDWNVNLGGSGFALQSTSANMLLLAALALVALWVLRK